jgi:hypothetical protein
MVESRSRIPALCLTAAFIGGMANLLGAQAVPQSRPSARMLDGAAAGLCGLAQEMAGGNAYQRAVGAELRKGLRCQTPGR